MPAAVRWQSAWSWHWRPAVKWMLVGTLVLAAPLKGGSQPFQADGPLDPVELRCRMGNGPWRDCLMVVEQIGATWSLQVGSERIDFAHDGRGQVRMQRGRAAWIPVQSRWGKDATLCWDGICAKGEIPLD